MKRNLIAISGALALGACAAVPPAGPSVLAIPSQGKTLAEFQGEDASCRSYAQSRLPDPADVQRGTAQNSVVAGLAGTAIGAGLGAALGSIGAAAGGGAAVGAVAGALVGTSIGADQAGATSAGLQQTYDTAYIQCMASKGDAVQSAPGVAAVYPYPYYGPAYAGPVVGFGFGPYYGRYYGRYYY